MIKVLIIMVPDFFNEDIHQYCRLRRNETFLFCFHDGKIKNRIRECWSLITKMMSVCQKHIFGASEIEIIPISETNSYLDDMLDEIILSKLKIILSHRYSSFSLSFFTT